MTFVFLLKPLIFMPLRYILAKRLDIFYQKNRIQRIKLPASQAPDAADHI